MIVTSVTHPIGSLSQVIVSNSHHPPIENSRKQEFSEADMWAIREAEIQNVKKSEKKVIMKERTPESHVAVNRRQQNNSKSDSIIGGISDPIGYRRM